MTRVAPSASLNVPMLPAFVRTQSCPPRVDADCFIDPADEQLYDQVRGRSGSVALMDPTRRLRADSCPARFQQAPPADKGAYAFPRFGFSGFVSGFWPMIPLTVALGVVVGRMLHIPQDL